VVHCLNDLTPIGNFIIARTAIGDAIYTASGPQRQVSTIWQLPLDPTLHPPPKVKHSYIIDYYNQAKQCLI